MTVYTEGSIMELANHFAGISSESVTVLKSIIKLVKQDPDLGQLCFDLLLVSDNGSEQQDLLALYEANHNDVPDWFEAAFLACKKDAGSIFAVGFALEGVEP